MCAAIQDECYFNGVVGLMPDLACGIEAPAAWSSRWLYLLTRYPPQIVLVRPAESLSKGRRRLFGLAPLILTCHDGKSYFLI